MRKRNKGRVEGKREIIGEWIDKRKEMKRK